MEKSAFEDVEMSQDDNVALSGQPNHDPAAEFYFQQTLAVHDGSVRALGTHPQGEVLMSGSIDKTNKLYNLNSSTGKYEFEKEVKYHDGFVMAIEPMVTGLGFFSAGRDNKVYVIDLQGDPCQLL